MPSGKDSPRIGGQAIIEGVMMRSPERISAVVRLPSGETTCKTWESKAWARRHKLLGLPIVRGAVSLAEALVLGIRTLNWSAEVALAQEQQERSKKQKRRDSLGLTASLVVAVVLAVGLFMLVPYEIATLLKTDRQQPLFHLVAGSTRIVFFLVYLWIISQLKDVRRLFQYHGAEHQSIFSYEKGEELSPESMRRQSRFHPRCGTSFLLIVALLVMAGFIVFDTAVTAWWGAYPNALIRLVVHLPFLPLIAGLSYEVLRVSDRFSDSAAFQLLIAPGLALQRLTTRPPDDSQREVAREALLNALDVKAETHLSSTA
jgi:uncharacterized protein YqhQ